MEQLIYRQTPSPLGAHLIEGGVAFKLAAPNATRVELCLFDAAGKREIARHDMPDRDGAVWTGFLPKAKSGLVYGYRVHGPYAPDQGHRFNPAKLALDPFARALAGAFSWTPAHYGYPLQTGHPDAGLDTRDNAAWMLKGRVVDLSVLPRIAPGPRTPWRDTLIYETHVRGFTMRLPDLSTKERGCFAGLAAPAAVRYLRALGVTAIELLPIHSFLDDSWLVDKGLRNFWGYNTINYFTPQARYASSEPMSEFRSFVNTLHETGLEVLLDVVYNHTCEGDHRGPSLSFRAIDNAAFYRLNPKNPARYADISGCGATLDAAKPLVQRLILDSLVHWATVGGVDGFRFDIATQLGVESDGRFNPCSALLQAIAAEPALAGKKLIAEAWDAAGGYQVGGFPKGWSEWNGKARDAIRQFWRGDEAMAGEFAQRFAGSPDLYASKGRPATASINFVACHDDFPLHDLTRYAEKHNHANGENNRDGPDHSLSCNYGVEGETADAAIQELRERQAHNMLLSALFARGVPMLLAGDEFGRTQGGNNNAFAQDNETSWLDWDLAASRDGQRRLALVRQAIALRAALRPADDAVVFLAPRGAAMTPADWALPYARCFGALWRLEDGGEALAWFNADAGSVTMTMPHRSRGWALQLATHRALDDTTIPADGSRLTFPDHTFAIFRTPA
jgi:glycogen operon protein